ncbi:MAG: pantoate--beta-alanine ligase [Nocardioidaceae bacterium]
MTAPSIARTRAELADLVGGRAGSQRPSVVLVPTMGALHTGHARLLDVARGRGELLIASIFVNPLQFAPGEDLDRYPRTFDSDIAMCAEHDVDFVFAPTVDEVYPGGPAEVVIEPGPLGTVLEGASRPGHFRGVLTVVAKLFGLVGPDVAVFGEKDYQQFVLIRRMVDDLCMPVEVVGSETVREDDGLALSSRNRFLSESERATALALSRALRAGRAAQSEGADVVRRAAQAVLAAATGLDLDYLAVTDEALGPEPADGPARLLVAARVGATRLIDNVSLRLGS